MKIIHIYLPWVWGHLKFMFCSKLQEEKDDLWDSGPYLEHRKNDIYASINQSFHR